jgi:hypothetical protein
MMRADWMRKTHNSDLLVDLDGRIRHLIIVTAILMIATTIRKTTNDNCSANESLHAQIHSDGENWRIYCILK